jgi:hypothetical protein
MVGFHPKNLDRKKIWTEKKKEYETKFTGNGKEKDRQQERFSSSSQQACKCNQDVHSGSSYYLYADAV